MTTNLNAFRYGRATGEFYTKACALGAKPKCVLTLLDHLRSATLDPAAAKPWADVLKSPLRESLEALWQAEPTRMLQGTPNVAEGLLGSGMGSLTVTKD